MTIPEIIETGGAALLWGALFLWGGGARIKYAQFLDRHGVTAFGAGISVAYVFVHMMPELNHVTADFAASVSVAPRYEETAIYFLALLGFLAFRGLDHLHERLRDTATETATVDFRLHVGGFAVYVLVMGYLLADGLEGSRGTIALYAVAIAFHFLAVDRAFHYEHGALYERIGRPVLAAMPVIGWATGMLYALPQYIIALLVAFLSGAIVMNSTVMELYSERGGQFPPMMAGGVIYGIILAHFG